MQKLEIINNKIYVIRNQKVMLDFDLAFLYQIDTKVLKQAVRRNIERFPEDFMFELTIEEFDNLRSQIVTSSYGGTRYMPFVFTEQGVAMLSSVLNSKKAIEVNIAIMRTFVVLRNSILSLEEITNRVSEIEQQFMRNTIYDAYRIVANSFSSDSVMSNRETFEDRIQTILTKNLSKDGFVYDQLTSAITPPESLRQMIDEKNASIQARLKAENQAKQADAEAKVKVATAQGEAQALLVRAKSEAEANRLRQASLTPMLIQQEWIKKWDGKLPTTQAGGGMNLMMPIK